MHAKLKDMRETHTARQVVRTDNDAGGDWHAPMHPRRTWEMHWTRYDWSGKHVLPPLLPRAPLLPRKPLVQFLPQRRR